MQFDSVDVFWEKWSTPPRTPRISETKNSGLETNIFELKMMMKSGLDFLIWNSTKDQTNSFFCLTVLKYGSVLIQSKSEEQFFQLVRGSFVPKQLLTKSIFYIEDHTRKKVLILLWINIGGSAVAPLSLWPVGLPVLIFKNQKSQKPEDYFEENSLGYWKSRNKFGLEFKVEHSYYVYLLPYARHYNPRFVYFSSTFWSSFMYCDLWPYVWLVFKSGF